MNYTTILVTDHDRVWTITLHRPERRNAMTPAMQAELIAAMEDAVASGCRALILAGAGDAFCAGLDLSALQALQNQAESEQLAHVEQTARLFGTLYELPIPTIAAVHGAAIAGGAGLATICDFTFATPGAKFGFTEVRIGFVPALVSAYLALRIGEKRSRDLLLTGRILDAAEAHQLGLVNEVVRHDELTERVQSLARTLIANSPQSLRATKRLLAAQNKPWLDAAIAQAIEASLQAQATADFQEGIAAFLEKRKPHWPE